LYSIVIVPDLIGTSEDWKPSAESELAQANPKARVFVYEYTPPQVSNGGIEITSEEIKNRARFLRAASLDDKGRTDGQTTQGELNGADNSPEQGRCHFPGENDQVPVILVACGYGGLLCEEALVSGSGWQLSFHFYLSGTQRAICQFIC